MRQRPDRFVNENALLIAACHIGATSGYQPPVLPIDWSYVLRASEAQGVGPLLHDWIQDHSETGIDEAAASFLQQAYWANHFRNRMLLAEWQRVSESARAAGIDLMPLKGARLATDFYPAAALRPMSDVDVLVRPRDLESFGRLLRSLGYTSVKPFPSYIDDRCLDEASRESCWVAKRSGLDVLIECRTQPLELAAGRLTDLDPALTATLHEYAAGVWKRADGAGASGSAGPQMAAADLLLHVATHSIAKHLNLRLIWVHDLARISARATDIDWDEVWEWARRLRITGVLAASLHAAVRWSGASVGRDVPERASGDSAVAFMTPLERWEYRRLVNYIESLGWRDLSSTGPALWPLGSALTRVSGWRPRLRVLRWVALPSRAYLAHRRSRSHPAIG